MASSNLSVTGAWWGTSGSSSWTSAGNNSMYVGVSGGVKYRSCIEISTAGLVISSRSKLVIKMKPCANSSPKGLKAFLTEGDYDLDADEVQNSNQTDGSSALVSNAIAYSYAYEDVNCTTKAGTDKGSSYEYYLVFDTDRIRANTTYNIYFVRSHHWYTGTGWNQFKKGDITCTLTYISYTNCGQAKNLSVTCTKDSNNIIQKGSKITIKWGAADGGNSNAVNGYKIYYTIGDTATDPTTSSSNSGILNASTREYTLDVSSQGSGKKIKFGIETIGTQTGYNSALLVHGTTYTINHVPGQPTLGKTSVVLPSYGGTASISVTAGSDTNTTQSKTLYYATSSTGTKTHFTSPFTTTSTGTYYFYTYDGLNFSSAKTATVTLNTQPTCSISLSQLSQYSGTTYTKGFTATATRTGGSPTQYKFEAIYGSSASTLNTTALLQDWSAANSIAMADIRSKIGVNKCYKIKVTCKDAFETGGTATSATAYWVRENPSGVTLGNGLVNTLTDYFSNTITVTQANLASYGYNQIILLKQDKQTTYKTATPNSNGVCTFSISATDVSVYPRGSQANFYVCLYDSITKYKSSVIDLGKKTRIQNIAGVDLNVRWSGTINPFVCDDQSISIRNFLTPDNCKAWGFSSVPAVDSNSREGDYEILATFGTQATKFYPKALSPSGNDATLTVSGAVIYSHFSSSFDMNKNSTSDQSVSIKISAKNAFGDVMSGTTTKTVNWCTESSSTLSDTSATITNTTFLKESVVVALSFKLKSYHGAPSSISVWGKCGTATFYPQKTFQNCTVTTTGTLGHKSPQTHTYTLDITVGAQSADRTGSATFQISMSNGCGGTLQSTIYITSNGQAVNRVYKHVAGNASIVSGRYTGNNIISFQINVGSVGISSIFYNSTTYAKFTAQVLKYNENNKSWSNAGYILNTSATTGQKLSDLISTTTFDHSFSEFSGENPPKFKKFKIKITVKFYTNSAGAQVSTKEFYTNEFAVYNLAPTLSYEPNKVGINYKLAAAGSSFADASLIVGQHSGATKVYFVGQGQTEGQTIAEINLSNGQISGFVIDCGDWT